MFNFSPGQILTTYAYEVDKKTLQKLQPYNFVHILQDQYVPSPRLSSFSENETLRAIGFKIYRDIGRQICRKVFEEQIKALNFTAEEMNETNSKNMY